MKTYLTPIVIAALLVTVTLGIVACSAGFRGSINKPTSSINPTPAAEERPMV